VDVQLDWLGVAFARVSVALEREVFQSEIDRIGHT
jgi:hypothetical protein